MQNPFDVPAALTRQPWWSTARMLSFDSVVQRLAVRNKAASVALFADFIDLYQLTNAPSATVDKLAATTTFGDWVSTWKPLTVLTAFGRIERLRAALVELDQLLAEPPPATTTALAATLRAMPLRTLLDRVRSEGTMPPYSAYHLANTLGIKTTVGDAFDSPTCTLEVRGFIEGLNKRLTDDITRAGEARAARLEHWRREAGERGGTALLALQGELAATELALDEATRARLSSNWLRMTDRYEVRLAGALTCMSGNCRHVDVLFSADTPVATCERGTVPCRAKLAAVEHALDTLVRDDDNGRVLREHLEQPAWQRMLERLRLAAVGPADKRKVGWVLKLPTELAPCWIEAKKNGGVKATKLTRADLMDYEPERADEQLAFTLYVGANEWDPDNMAHVVGTFAGREGLYARTEREVIPVRVRVAEPRVEVVPTPDGSRIVVRLGDSPIEATPPRIGSWTMTLDADDGVVHLAFWTRATRLASQALTSNTTVPTEAASPLTETLLGLGSRIAVKKDASWLGRPFAPDHKVSFRLGFEGPRGARQLAIEARVQPVPELGGLVPGLGEAVVPVRRDGEVGHVTRDFALERELVANAAHAVGLGPDSDGDATWRIKGLDEAMAIWTALTIAAASDPILEVVWTNKSPSVQRSRGVDKLALRLAVKRDWLDVRGGFQIEGGELPIAELLDALRDKKRFIEIDDGRVLEIGEALSKELAPLSALVRDNDGGIRTSVLAAPIIAELAKLGASIDGPPEWLNASQRLTEAATLEVPLPAAIDAVLRPYQLEGLTWAARLAHWARGACLADEMGLGKTLQALALIAHRHDAGPVLVVAPTSVVPNWMREIGRFAPSLEARVIASGGGMDALDGLATKSDKRAFALLVTSWDLVVRHEARFGAITWGTLVLDEAHAMKNSGTKRAQVIKALPADFVLALTGTPVENRPSELWSLFQAIAPGLLGSAESFRNNFGKPISEGDNDAVRRLSRLVRPFVLRRTKAKVALDLPEKTEVRVDIVLSQTEREHYERVRRSALAELAKDAAPLTGLEKGQQVFKVLVVLTRLRQLACHPRLVDPHAGPTSAKLDRLVELVSELRDEGRKVLVFSQFTELLALVRTAFDAAHLTFAYLDGQTAAEHRMREVDLFQSGERDAFLLSLKAGGVGLNLTAASEVIHLDPWWNPAVEDQATGRAHRIGQAKPVTVYRLVTQGTVEEQILALHADKRTLVAGLLDGTGSAAALSADELIALLSEEGLETEPSSISDVDAPSAPITPEHAPARATPQEPSAPVSNLPRSTPLALVIRALQQSKSAMKRADILAATNIDEALWAGLKIALESDDNIALSGQSRGRAYRWTGPVNAGS